MSAELELQYRADHRHEVTRIIAAAEPRLSSPDSYVLTASRTGKGFSSAEVVRWSALSDGTSAFALIEKTWSLGPAGMTLEIQMEEWVYTKAFHDRDALSFSIPRVYEQVVTSDRMTMYLEDASAGRPAENAKIAFNAPSEELSETMRGFVQAVVDFNTRWVRPDLDCGSLRRVQDRTPSFLTFSRTQYRRIEERLSGAFLSKRETQEYLRLLKSNVVALKTHSWRDACALNHCDLHPGNAFVRDGKIVLLDFGSAIIAPPVFDIAHYSAASITLFGNGGAEAPALINRLNAIVAEYLSRLQEADETLFRAEDLVPLYRAIIVCLGRKIRRGAADGAVVELVKLSRALDQLIAATMPGVHGRTDKS
jgi:hypothetical protein